MGSVPWRNLPSSYWTQAHAESLLWVFLTCLWSSKIPWGCFHCCFFPFIWTSKAELLSQYMVARGGSYETQPSFNHRGCLGCQSKTTTIISKSALLQLSPKSWNPCRWKRRERWIFSVSRVPSHRTYWHSSWWNLAVFLYKTKRNMLFQFLIHFEWVLFSPITLSSRNRFLNLHLLVYF